MIKLNFPQNKTSKITMQVLQLLHKSFMNKISSIHKLRLNSLITCVYSLIDGKRLTLTLLGRNMNSQAKVRSNIRKVDRLLANVNLHKERTLFYADIASRVINPNSKPELHIDWSCLSAKHGLYVLRASLAAKGRSIVIYEETHPKVNENNHNIHVQFLKNLKAILPHSVKPIIVTDAGFRAIWFAHVVKMEWDFVGRVRNNNLVYLENNRIWQNSKNLYELATAKAKKLGKGILTKTASVKCTFIVYKEEKKSSVKFNQNKKRSTSSKNKKYRRMHQDPWLIVTSLASTNNLAKRAVKIYSRRMQIEENFRDTKSRKYGFGLNESETRSVERMDILLLINAIATFACWLAGLTVQAIGKAADYQAHSAKFTKVLSVVYLGCEALRNGFKITINSYLEALKKIVQLSCSQQEATP